MSMEWHIVTCDNSRHIVPVQKHLFKKYVPGADVRYIDLGSEPVETWTHNVAAKLTTTADHIIFGLDDFLPIDETPYFPFPDFKFNRLELGWGGSRKGKAINDNFRLYHPDESYRVSCQFSIWRTEALRAMLVPRRSPWQFEVKSEMDGNVLGLMKPWRYIEESAVSGRRPGMVNLCGLRLNDIEELIDLKLVDESKIIYGWKGTAQRTKEAYGTQYAAYY